MRAAVTRCVWAGFHPLCRKYHDTEWGVPLHADKKLFEFLVLQGMQAGLSWVTILKKRRALRDAFDQFDYDKVAEYGNDKIRELLDNPGIIRNPLKINAARDNARALLRVREEFGTFDEYIWDFVDRKPLQNAWKAFEDLPAKTALAETISKDLKRRGFRFVGPTIVYAHMQATGMVNDHTTDCFRHGEIGSLGSSR